jgi:hypothetical protein
MRKIALIACLLLPAHLLLAQRFAGHPTGTQWRQVNNDTVRVIFPRGLEQQALDVVTTIRALGLHTLPTIGDRARKISIVLQPHTTVSNGYVGLGPRRSELLLTPRQNPFELGSMPWHQYLTLHEYRHVQQYNNFRKGISKAFSILFGQDGLSLAASAAVPNWFWEGDAVYQETLLSEQGRGRLPYFFNDFRSLWAAGKNYSWMKLRNGSLRDLVPDHYRLGYLLVAYGREKYGDDFWRKVTDDAVRYKGLFYPFQRAVKKYSGQLYKDFRENALQYFRDSAFHYFAGSALPFFPESSPGYYRSGLTDAGTLDSLSRWAAAQRHFAEDQEFPQWISDDSLVFVRSSYRRIPAFVVQHAAGGPERKIRVRDISLDNYFSYRNGQLVYTAYEPDQVWNWHDYSVIKILDMHTGQQRTLSHKSKYFAPDLSPDGSKVVAVQLEPGKDTALHVLDAITGEVLHRVPNPDGLIYNFPKFYNNETIVSAVRNREGAMTLALVQVNDGSMQTLLPWTYQVIGFPQVHGDTITFSASRNGQDVLYALIGEQLYLLSTKGINVTTGNYQWSMRNGKATWSAFTAAGQRLVVKHIEAGDLAPVSPETITTPLPAFSVRFPAPISLEAPVLPSDSIVRFPKINGIINVHSWRPYISDPDYTFSLLSQNVLNTLQGELYFNYNRNEKFKETGASLVYGGLFPYLTVAALGLFHRTMSDTPTATTWNEFGARVGVLAPFNFTSGRYYKNLTLAAGYNVRNVYYTGLAKNRYLDGRFSYLDFSASYTAQLQQARMHIYPRLGLALHARYRTTTKGGAAHQWLTSNSLYLPGISQTHNLVLNAAYHARDTLGNYFFTSSFPFSRGYTNINFPRMWKLGVNYHFPLLYPDWGFGNIVYFLRVRANGFYDHTDVQILRTGMHFQFRSAGTEIYFDTKWWNEYNVSFGFRYSYLYDSALLGLSPHQWEFILPVNLLGR